MRRKSKISGLFAGLLALLLTLAIMPGVASADNSDDATRAIGSQGWYISKAIEPKVGDLSAAQNSLKGTVQTLKDRKLPVVIALLDTATLPVYKNCKTGAMSDCGDFFLKSQSAQIAVVFDLTNATPGNRKVGLFSPGLNEGDQQALTSDPAFGKLVTAGNYAQAASQLAINAANKIDVNTKSASDAQNAATQQIKKEESNGLFVAMIVVVVVVLAIGGAIAFLIMTTKKVWNGKVEELQKNASQVNDMVLRLSDEVEYLEPNVKDSAKATFAQGALQVNTANEAARQIKAASTISLLFKWGQYNTQYQEALAKMQSVQETLNRVDQTVKRDIGGSLPKPDNVPQQLGEYEQNSR